MGGCHKEGHHIVECVLSGNEARQNVTGSYEKKRQKSRALRAQLRFVFFVFSVCLSFGWSMVCTRANGKIVKQFAKPYI